MTNTTRPPWRHRLAAAGAYASLASLTAISSAHTASTVCTIETAARAPGAWPCLAGIVAAVALEVGALSLAYGAAHAYAVTGRHSRVQWLGVVALSAVACFTNLDAVGGAIAGVPFTVDRFAALDGWRSAKVVVLSVAWPLLAVAMASTLERLAVQTEAERQAPAAIRASSPATPQDTRPGADAPRPAGRAAGRRRPARKPDAHPDPLGAILAAVATVGGAASNADLGRAVGMSRQTASNWLRRAADAGMVAGKAGAWRLTEAGRARVDDAGGLVLAD